MDTQRSKPANMKQESKKTAVVTEIRVWKTAPMREVKSRNCSSEWSSLHQLSQKLHPEGVLNRWTFEQRPMIGAWSPDTVCICAHRPYRTLWTVRELREGCLCWELVGHVSLICDGQVRLSSLSFKIKFFFKQNLCTLCLGIFSTIWDTIWNQGPLVYKILHLPACLEQQLLENPGWTARRWMVCFLGYWVHRCSTGCLLQMSTLCWRVSVREDDI